MKPLRTTLLVLLMTAPAQAQTISNDVGGYVARYAVKVADLKRSGEQVRFTGICYSACTLYLSLPAKQICIGPGAEFGFHTPFGGTPDENQIVKVYLMRNYPKWVKTWIAGHGGLTDALITMDYSTASKHIRRCA